MRGTARRLLAAAGPGALGGGGGPAVARCVRAMSAAADRTKGIVIQKFGELSYAETRLPPLPDSHVLVEVAAATVNPADTYMCQGKYTMQPNPPFTPGLEGSGRVVAVGAAVTCLSVGDPVIFSVTAADGGVQASTGSWAHHCVVRSSLAVRVPEGCDLVAAAAIPIAYLTAHRALFHVTRTQPTDRVLVRGASGAVGLAAVHLARHFGASGRLVVGTAGSEEGRAAVQQRGGQATGHREAQISEVAGGQPFDVIVELMANENLGSDLQLLAPGGRVAVIGSRPGAQPVAVDARLALVKEASVHGVFLWKQTEQQRAAAYKDIFDAFANGKVPWPAVRRFPFGEAQVAHDIVVKQAEGTGKTEGKVVLVNEGAQETAAGRSQLPSRPSAGSSGAAVPAVRLAAVEAARSARVIDLHAHAVLEATLGAAGPYGPEVGETDGKPWFRIGDYYLRNVQYRGSPFMDVDARIARMDKYGIDLQVLSPNPLTYFHHIEGEQAAVFCRRHNDALAALVASRPGRLAGLAALPMQRPDLAVEELERSVRQLGLLGAYAGTEFGMPLDDPRLDPFYARCCELDVPLFFHPAPRGIDGPAADARLKRFELDVVLGFNLETTVAIATLVYGGVLLRHPTLDVCFPSGGGAIGSLVGRMTAATIAPRPWVPAELREKNALRQQLRRLWFDTHMHDDAALRLVRTHCGDDHLVFGTNFAGWDQEQGDNPPDISSLDLVGNARRLLRLQATSRL